MKKIDKCKYCTSDKFYLKDMGPHVGLYCQVCGKWQKWISRYDIPIYQKQDVNSELQNNIEIY